MLEGSPAEQMKVHSLQCLDCGHLKSQLIPGHDQNRSLVFNINHINENSNSHPPTQPTHPQAARDSPPALAPPPPLQPTPPPRAPPRAAPSATRTKPPPGARGAAPGKILSFYQIVVIIIIIITSLFSLCAHVAFC